MAKHNAANTRIKREYFQYLKEAMRRDESSIDAVAKALARFEDANGYKDFRKFHREQAVAFKRKLDTQIAVRTGKPLSRATVHSTLSALRAFFIWLAGQPGYKSKIAYADADYFNLSEKDVRIAKAAREKPVPTLEQIHHVLVSIPAGSDIELRNRALIAFAILTGARDGALASLKLPELQFKGKEFVYNHHLTVPFRPLEMHADKGIGEARLDGNLIVHGDNLHALKALLPMYAGKVDCIYIDPPYNTGKEGWCYNDNVNAPFIKDWFEKEIDLADALRHEKWACMMWPRLRMLHELASDEAIIFISIGDLARDVHLPGSEGGAAGVPRPVQRREGFKALRIALPRVLVAEGDDAMRELDAETDLFPQVDWAAFDMAALVARLPKDARPPDNQFMRLAAGDHGVETVSAVTLANAAEFDAAYAVRSIADLVPNSFIAWDIVIALRTGLAAAGWDDDLIGRLSAFLIAELRKDLAAERDRQAAALFAAGLDGGTIKFGLRGGDADWIMPAETWTTIPVNSQELRGSNNGTLERSLFFPIYAAELNTEEQKFAVYLDRDDALRWWHRNGTTPKNYALRGWRRGNVYPDFLFAALQEGERDRIVVIETKGEQLAGNPDTEYKRALLAMLSDKFDPIPPQSGGLEDEAFDFSAAVVLFGELDAKLPAVIRGDART